MISLSRRLRKRYKMWLNKMCEAQLQWYYDNGIFYINGRDVVCIITGILIGILFALLYELLKYLTEERKKRK